MSYPETTSFHQEFLKGNPKCLGRTLSLIGSLQGCVGAGLFYTASYIVMYSGIPFWGAIFNLIAGSLSVAAVSKPSMSLIKGAVGLSIVICIISFVGLMLNVVDFIPDYNCPGLYDCKGYICH